MSNGTPPASNPAGAGPGERSGEVGGKLPSLYDDIGGKEAVEALVEAFYDIVENEPEGRALLVHHLRGHGVAHSRIEQFNLATRDELADLRRQVEELQVALNRDRDE